MEKRKECSVEYLEKSEEIVGYKTKIRSKKAFQITGYTLIVPPNADSRMIPRFWSEVMADGSFEALGERTIRRISMLMSPKTFRSPRGA